MLILHVYRSFFLLKYIFGFHVPTDLTEWYRQKDHNDYQFQVLHLKNNFKFYSKSLSPTFARGRVWTPLYLVTTYTTCMLRCVLIFIEGSRSLSRNNVIGIIIVTTGGNISTMGNNNNNIQCRNWCPGPLHWVCSPPDNHKW